MRIINLAKGEPDVGHKHSGLGKLYVSVVIPGGIRKQRITKNLRLLYNEEGH